MLSIGSFSKISNVTTKTLRYYDEIDILKPTHVNKNNGYRYYDVEQLKTILLINKLKQYKFSLEEISEVLKNMDDYGNDELLHSMIKQKKYFIQKEINHYIYIMTNIEKDINKLERGIGIMDYLNDIKIKLVETENKNIYYIREKINIKDFKRNIYKLFEIIAREDLTMIGEPIAIYYNKEFTPDNYDVEIAIPIKEVVKGTRTFKGGLCAMSTLIGNYSELPSVYASLKQWIEDKGYKISSAPYEIYLNNPEDISSEECITEIYFPIEK